MKSLRILMLAGFWTYGTIAVVADELPSTVGAADVSEGPVDDKTDGAADENRSAEKTEQGSVADAGSPPEQAKTTVTDNEATQPEVLHEERWVLGIQCDGADPLLRQHLKLGSAGLVILQVRAETPAAESALQPGDIITHINDEELMCREDLMEAVTLSNGASLTLSLLRDGEPLKIQVTPRRMMVPIMISPAISRPATDDKDSNGDEVRGSKIFQGVLIHGMIPFDENNPEQIDVDALVKKLREMTVEQPSPQSDGTDDIVIAIPDSESTDPLSEEMLRRNIAALKEHLQAMQKKLAQLESRLKAIQPQSEVP